MMKAKASHQNKFMKILSIPIRALAKARDFYVKSMNNYADKVHYGAGPGWGSAPYSVPRSFSTNSARSSEEDDFKELMRAASTNTLGKRIDLNAAFSGASKSNSSTTRSRSQSHEEMQQQQQHGNGIDGKVIRRVPRSASVGMAKIEEDKPCEFVGDVEISNVNGAKKDESKVAKEKFSAQSRTSRGSDA
ncbi:hypothetical protein Cgig2_008212 [Carnegiea gigantea]|uniref:Uncharacterized protein n=1 Tax=Carnegiea gigantea TaxID=171969 RepID=A0A9Q1QS20_9CARY|nr:hypothetical protein Cgig2_008212 [Carnegiea gigantea]